MKLPNAEKASIPREKLHEYCLSLEHPKGKDKAFLFKELLGITVENAEILVEAILIAVKDQEAIHTKTINFGELYQVDFPFYKNQRKFIIRSCWIIKKGTKIPALTTCFILKSPI